MKVTLLENVFKRLLVEINKELDSSLMKVFDALLTTKWASDTFRTGELWKFVEINKDSWDRILTFGVPKQLSNQGGVGLAMSIGPDKVLKLQITGESGKTTGDVFYHALKNNEAIAPYIPMVYENGTMEIPSSKLRVEWHVMEKVEVIPDDILKDVEEVFTAIYMRKNVRNPRTIVKQIREAIPEEIEKIESRVRVSKGWLVNLVKSYWY